MEIRTGAWCNSNHPARYNFL